MPIYTRRHSLKLGLAALAGLPLLLAGTRRAQAATHQVSIEGFAFVPAQLSVSAGDTVVFTNADGAPHTATTTGAGSGFDTGTIKKGKSASVTITAAGRLAYKCKFHPKMTGVITAA